MKEPFIRTLAIAGLIVAFAAAAPGARAQQPGQKAPSPCTAAEADQFDFWVGTWEATWKGGTGTNRVEKIMGGCVIQENFDGTPAMPLQGMSVSTWNAKLGKWRQTWVDNQGGYLDFAGGFENNRMTLTRPAPVLGDNVLQRMVWSNINKNSFDWNWERSDDGGKTWKVNWQIAYLRAGTAGAVSTQAQHFSYAAHQDRDIKALSAEQTAQFLAGDGMGLAMAAELNGYPGPKHLLELVDELELTRDQVARIEMAFDKMHHEASQLGEVYIESERLLDRLFAEGEVDAANLKYQVIKSGRLRAGVRFTHLRAHLMMIEILTPEQVEAYGRLRGYHEPGREHDPTLHERHSNGS